MNNRWASTTPGSTVLSVRELATLDAGRTLFGLGACWVQLEGLLEREVDVVPDDGLNPGRRRPHTALLPPRATAKDPLSARRHACAVERIRIDPGVHFGKTCVRGTRIPVGDVLELVEEGIAFDAIVRDYDPDLEVADVRACVLRPVGCSSISCAPSRSRYANRSSGRRYSTANPSTPT